MASRLNLEVPTEDGGRIVEDGHAEVLGTLAAAADWFREQLRQHESRERAVEYLKRRGLSGEIALEYGIGYAPPGYHQLLDALGTDPARVDRLERAGLLSHNDQGRRYDKFRDRVMFPILDRRGRTVGFGGRVIGDGEPKYLNSPETPVFHKGREVYGLYELRRAERTPERIFVVEGYLDVVALAQHGIRNAVATLGTAATAEHLQQLFRASPDLVFCFDGDRAGRQAAWRALEHALPLLQEGRQALFMFLPEGQDPDSLVRSLGAPAFAAAAADAMPLSAYFYQQLTARTDLATAEGRARLVDLARPHLDRIPAGAFRQVMIRRLAELVRMDVAEVSALLGGQPVPVRPKKPGARPAQGRPLSLMAQLIVTLLRYPRLAQNVPDATTLRHVSRPGADLLVALLELARGNPDLNMAALVEHFRGTVHHPHLVRLATTEDLAGAWSDPQAQFSDGLNRLLAQETSLRYRELLEKSRSEPLSAPEQAELRALLGRIGAVKGA